MPRTVICLKDSEQVLPNSHFKCFRSSRPGLFLGKGVLKIHSKFTREHPCQSVISIKLLCTLKYVYDIIRHLMNITKLYMEPPDI